MPGNLFSFDPPDRFVLGTVGQPGERAFFLQATDGERVVTVALEKVQAQLLAERLDDLLDEIRRRGFEVPIVAPPELEDVAPLDQPILEEFRVGTLALKWEGEDSLVVIEARSRVESEESAEELEDAEELDDEDPGDVLRVRLPASMARAFVKRALRVVASGRPPCPLCGLPLDPEGHLCPRQNGHRS